MTTIRCENSKCKKVVGELEAGRNVRFKCKSCSHITTVTIEAAPQQLMPAVTTKEGQRLQ